MHIKKLLLPLLLLVSNYVSAIELKEKHKTSLQNARLCFYPGTFDPLHKGHENVIDRSLGKFCDYILIYPSWGKDPYKLNKSSLSQRQKTLNRTYAGHPEVLLTKMSPKELHEFFIDRTDFTFLIGSDVAKWLVPGVKMSHEYGTGKKPTHNNNWGGYVALHAENFVIFLRNDDEAKDFGRELMGKKILEIVDSPKEMKEISSTKIKMNINLQKLLPPFS